MNIDYLFIKGKLITSFFNHSILFDSFISSYLPNHDSSSFVKSMSSFDSLNLDKMIPVEAMLTPTDKALVLIAIVTKSWNKILLAYFLQWLLSYSLKNNRFYAFNWNWFLLCLPANIFCKVGLHCDSLSLIWMFHQYFSFSYLLLPHSSSMAFASNNMHTLLIKLLSYNLFGQTLWSLTLIR